MRLSGKVSSNAPGCFATVWLTIKRNIVGGRKIFEKVRTVRTNDTGNFGTFLRPRRSASYKATARATATCAGGASPGRFVKVS